MSVVTPFPSGQGGQVGFDRDEFMTILDLYGRMVAAGHWRDYAIRMDKDVAVFACFRRHAENPEIRIEKRPALRQRQGAYAVITEHGQVLKRGHDLKPVLAPLERRLMRLVRD
ncbi:DUF2794 domain-containing protein [Sphingomicrobium sediminis]|uniref:DUF2794 domain-containing protein n=1 Tax=Sphingomicrobium sediminis TaxID=2950949 RepID=A0A9X2EH17_9SPHN|nr:DUF2794 domain-containing protein [Sphingomicrobium sediminis]MCM8557347.1 DUF2794 domain-containing protein [Sphingomicrobium sediminis]